MMNTPIVTTLCVLDRPASFRNRFDAKFWKTHLKDILEKGQVEEIEIFGSLTVQPPVDCLLSMEVLHLYASEHIKERDVDNSAKPIMDAFNRILYRDDVQIKQMQYTSAPIFSNQAAMILAENNGFLGGLLSPVLHRAATRRIGNDVTVIVFRDITELLAESEGDYFLWKSKAAVRMNFS